jgi:hypothetical protein
MSRGYTAILSLMIVGLCLSIGATLKAEDPGNDNSPTDGERDQTWYRSARDQLDAKTIIREKARRRAELRIARLETPDWYGRSSSRRTICPVYGDLAPQSFVVFPAGQVATYGPWISIASSNGQGAGPTGANSGWTANRAGSNFR